jgi:succinylarginine dihydrolase
MAVGNEALLLLHESAFVEPRALLEELRQRLGDGFRFVLATEDQFPSREAVESYAFNSQLITLPNGKMAIVAPRESEQCDAARRFMDRVVAEDNPVGEIFYIDVNASMRNGGGPACLRLRVVLTDAERACIRCRVILDDPLYDALTAWVERHYRDRLTLDDLADPAFIDETRAALDELSTLLALGSIYDFQRG